MSSRAPTTRSLQSRSVQSGRPVNEIRLDASNESVDCSPHSIMSNPALEISLGQAMRRRGRVLCPWWRSTRSVPIGTFGNHEPGNDELVDQARATMALNNSHSNHRKRERMADPDCETEKELQATLLALKVQEPIAITVS